MGRIEPLIKEGVKGHPGPIVTISEGSHIDRAVFNFVTHVLYDRPCETSEEIDEVWELMGKLSDEIQALLTAMPSVPAY